MAESIKGKTKYYIYDKKNPKQRIRDTYVEKEAKRYKENGHIVKQRTKRIKHD